MPHRLYNPQVHQQVEARSCISPPELAIFAPSARMGPRRLMAPSLARWRFPEPTSQRLESQPMTPAASTKSNEHEYEMVAAVVVEKGAVADVLFDAAGSPMAPMVRSRAIAAMSRSRSKDEARENESAARQVVL